MLFTREGKDHSQERWHKYYRALFIKHFRSNIYAQKQNPKSSQLLVKLYINIHTRLHLQSN